MKQIRLENVLSSRQGQKEHLKRRLIWIEIYYWMNEGYKVNSKEKQIEFVKKK